MHLVQHKLYNMCFSVTEW